MVVAGILLFVIGVFAGRLREKGKGWCCIASELFLCVFRSLKSIADAFVKGFKGENRPKSDPDNVS